MNHAIFAIPGLMPPRAVNFRRQIISPEDGSLKLLLHCGFTEDKVFYALTLQGHRSGVLKDPAYDTKNKKLEYPRHMPTKETTKDYPAFMTVSKQLADDVMVPRRRVHGCPIPITELTEAEEEEKTYFILELPSGSLPVGSTVVEVSINGKVYRYIVNRPDFAIGNWPDISKRWRKFQNQEGESINIEAVSGQETVVCLPLQEEAGNAAEIQAHVLMGEKETECSYRIDQKNLRLYLIIPAILPVGTGLWKAEYKISDDSDWQLLACGDIVISEPSSKD